MGSLLSPPKHIPRLADNLIDKVYKNKRLQVFLGIFIGYAGYYLVRKNFSLAMPSIIENMHYSKADLGLAFSANALAYGLSKFFMGGISDRSNARVFLALGLLVSAFLTIFAGTELGLSSIAMMFAIQFLIGWFQGMGWPPSGRIMTHWFSLSERGTKMALWNTAHNVGGGLIGILTAYATEQFDSWKIGVFVVPSILAILIAILAFFLVRDTPQSVGLPPIEEYKKDYPKDYSEKNEEELSVKDIFVTYVLKNKTLWLVALANVFVYLVRYGVLDWAPTYLKSEKNYDIKEIGWVYTAYEWAAIPGTIFCGWVSDKVFKRRRSITMIVWMILVALFIIVYWAFADNKALVSFSLISIGFLIYGPVMLIGVQALDLAPKKAAGTSAGFTGLFGYLFGTAILANVVMGYLVEKMGWNIGFILLIAACVITIILMAFTIKDEEVLLKKNQEN